MAILNERDIATQKPSTFFNFALRDFLLLSQRTEPISNIHVEAPSRVNWPRSSCEMRAICRPTMKPHMVFFCPFNVRQRDVKFAVNAWEPCLAGRGRCVVFAGRSRQSV